jgi:hypothetical protein
LRPPVISGRLSQFIIDARGSQSSFKTIRIASQYAVQVAARQPARMHRRFAIFFTRCSPVCYKEANDESLAKGGLSTAMSARPVVLGGGGLFF